jgi:hypothetical protein
MTLNTWHAFASFSFDVRCIRNIVRLDVQTNLRHRPGSFEVERPTLDRSDLKFALRRADGPPRKDCRIIIQVWLTIDLHRRRYCFKGFLRLSIDRNKKPLLLIECLSQTVLTGRSKVPFTNSIRVSRKIRPRDIINLIQHIIVEDNGKSRLGCELSFCAPTLPQRMPLVRRKFCCATIRERNLPPENRDFDESLHPGRTRHGEVHNLWSAHFGKMISRPRNPCAGAPPRLSSGRNRSPSGNSRSSTIALRLRQKETENPISISFNTCMSCLAAKSSGCACGQAPGPAENSGRERSSNKPGRPHKSESGLDSRSFDQQLNPLSPIGLNDDTVPEPFSDRPGQTDSAIDHAVPPFQRPIECIFQVPILVSAVLESELKRLNHLHGQNRVSLRCDFHICDWRSFFACVEHSLMSA